MDKYDAGLLGDGGGGNVAWWHDYIRAELDRAHEFYAAQMPRDVQYFVDNGDGTEYYDTEAEARKAAQDWIDEYRTLPEWDEAVERVCWGVVREYAWPEWTEIDGKQYVNYRLKEPK